MVTVPLDDFALDAIEHALGARLTYENGDYDNPIVVGADFTLPKLLDFLAGQDASDGHQEGDWWVCHQPSFSRDDLIRALVGEIRELRARDAIIRQPEVGYERPLDDVETALYDHFRSLGCYKHGAVVDSADVEDCAFMAVHVVAVLRQLGFMP